MRAAAAPATCVAISAEPARALAAKALPAGSIVRVTDVGGATLGLAAFNPHSLICARFLTRDPAEAIDTAQIQPYDGHVTLYMADRYHDDAIRPDLMRRSMIGIAHSSPSASVVTPW